MRASESGLCEKAFLGRVEFIGVQGKLSSHNYCQDAPDSVPLDVQRLVIQVAALHVKISAVLGEKPSALFSQKVDLVIRSNRLGSSESGGTASVVLIGTYPEWKLEDFPSTLYAHELMHFLAEIPGPYQNLLHGLKDHPFVLEAFPDLVSTSVQNTPKVTLAEANFPKCLRELRDETPVHSLIKPFSQYSYLAGSEKGIACCQSFTSFDLTAPVRAYCEAIRMEKEKKQSEKAGFLKTEGLRALALNDTNRAKNFQAKDCRAETRTGLVYFNHCDVHQFGYPLVSFFFRLQERTGKSQVSAFFRALRKSENELKTYECNYVARFYRSAVPARVALRPLVGAFRSLRASLKPADQVIYDGIWKEHGFDRFLDLDRLFTSEALPGLAQLAVNAENIVYSEKQGCDDVLNSNPKFCRVACQALRAK